MIPHLISYRYYISGGTRRMGKSLESRKLQGTIDTSNILPKILCIVFLHTALPDIYQHFFSNLDTENTPF